jgi:site-specific recombinase XerD
MNEILIPEIIEHLEDDLITRGSRNPVEALAGAFLAGFSNLRTRDAYRYDLKRWFEFAATTGIDILGAKRSMIDLFVRQMELDGLAPNTVNRRLTAMASFYPEMMAA